MTTMRVAKRDRYTTLDNALLNDERLSFKARGLLAWLLSKPNDWTVNSEFIATVGPDGRDAIRTGLKELEAAGYIRRTKTRAADGTFVTECVIYECSQDGFPAADNPAPDNPSSTKDSVPKTENSKMSSLRSDEDSSTSNTDPESTIAKTYWDWHVAENGGQPAEKFLALRAAVKGCLTRGYAEDEILDAMKREPRAITVKRLIERIGFHRREAENRASTAVIPTAVLADVTTAAPWFEERWPGWLKVNRVRVMETLATLNRWGYGVGESMIRMAVAMRDPEAALNPTTLTAVQINRFSGRLAQEHMLVSLEAAYRNRSWRAS